MRTKLVFLLVALSASVAKAQLPTGSWLTGACFRLAFNSYDDGDSKSSEVLVYPGTFYTLNENWGVGGGIFYQNQVDRYGDDQKNTTSIFGVSPGVRYYGKISDRVLCYGQGNVNLGWGSTKNDYDGNESKTSNSYYGVRLNPGILWNVGKKYHLDFSYGSLGYTSATYKNKDQDTKYTDSSFALDLNTWTLGVALYYLITCGEDYDEY
jgi:hypothetical protein